MVEDREKTDDEGVEENEERGREREGGGGLRPESREQFDTFMERLEVEE